MDYVIDYSMTDSDVTAYVKASKPSALRTIFDVWILCWGNIILSLVLFFMYPSIWTYALVFLMVSSRMNGCLTLAHDAWHTSLMPSRKWNDFYGGWLCSYPFGSVYGSARAGHLAHHKFLGTEEDPDRPMHLETDKDTLSHFIGHFARHMFVGQLIISLMTYLGPKKEECKKIPEEAKPAKQGGVPEFAYVVITQAIIGSTLWLVSGHIWMYFLVWFLPIVSLGTLCYFIRAFGDHGRLSTDPSGPVEGRLITIARILPWERAFVSCNEFNFHAEHHLYASVPHQHLPKLHDMLKEKPAYMQQVIVRNNYTSFMWAYMKEVSQAKPAIASK